MKGFLYTFIAIILLGLVTFFVYNHVDSPIEKYPPEIVSTSTQQTTTAVNSEGVFEVKLYETVRVEGVMINAWAVTEDSRCPANANCIWAGRVIVATNIGTAMGTSTHELEIGESVTTENKKITLKEVLPQKTLSKIADDEYRFAFMIEDYKAAASPAPKPIVTPQPQPSKKCHVGGCSAQLCSDQPGMASTCEYTERYACYKTAKCEVQTNGECGWTQTSELTKCLNNAQ